MSSSNINEKDRLALELRESVDSHVRLLQIPIAREDVRRDCATHILHAVVSFLRSWDQLEDTSDFPSGIVRDAFSTLLSEVGPGDAQVRATLLETISFLSATESRQALLDAMPWTMPVDAKELEEATRCVLETLRTVLMEDSDALLPVLGCLSLLPLSEKGRAEAWNVALASLAIVSDADLPVLARTLLCHVTNEEDAARALRDLRTEFELVESADNEEDDDPIPLIAHVLLGAFRDGENEKMLAKAYLDILRSIPTQDEGTVFLVLDVVAILALYQNSDVKSDVESMLDAWIKIKAFPFATFHLLLKIMCHGQRPGEPASVLYDRLVPSLLSLGIFLLLAPARIGTNVGRSADVHQFLVELHHRIDRDHQDEFVRCLLHLSDETSRYSEESTNMGKKRPLVRSRKHIGKASKYEGLGMTADSVHSLLQVLAHTARSSVARFKHILVQRLTSVPTNSSLDDLRSTKQLCAILTCLVEPMVAEPGSGIGINASEVMILLQKLLFTASYSADRRSTHGESMGDVGRVICGLILATELVQSEALNVGDKECIHLWVHRILLPSTRRTVDPEIGSHGLKFLSAWSTWRQRAQGDVISDQSVDNEQTIDMFHDVKMILANTGLIQMLTPYLEGRKNPNEVVLCYTTIPASFLIYSNPSGKHNNRDMVFCVNSFLRTSAMQSRWDQMVNWVYDLVDTYLTMGREGTNPNATTKTKGRTKWLPDGWLKASIELPSLNLVIEKAGSKTKTSAELLSRQLCAHGITYDSVSFSKSACSEVASALCNENTIDQVNGKIETVLRVALSFILGIGLSAAVLRNTNAHLLSLGGAEANATTISDAVSSPDETGSSRRMHELVKLMQYQVMKLYDLKRKTESSIQFLQALKATVRKEYLRGRSSRRGGRVSESDDSDIAVGVPESSADDDNIIRKASNIVSTVELATEQTRHVLSRIFATDEFINPEILLKCLLDTNDDALLINCLRQSTRSSAPAHFKMMVELRRSLLDHLCEVYQESSIHDGPVDEKVVSSVTCFMQMASAVSRLLPTFRKSIDTCRISKINDERDGNEAAWNETTTFDVSALSSSYFRLVKNILIKAKDAPDSLGLRIRQQERLLHEEKKCDGESTVLSCPDTLMDVFMHCTMKMNVTNSNPLSLSQNACSLAHAFKVLLEHLCICEDEASASELIDLLSILSSNQADLMNRTLEACWRVLHTVYADSHRVVINFHGDKPPHAFIEAITRANAKSQSPLAIQSKGHLVERVLSATIVRTAVSTAKNVQENAMLRRSLLVLWAIMAQPSSSTTIHGFDYLSKLVDELERFLVGINDTKTLSSCGIDHEISGSQDGMSRRRKTRNRRNRPCVSSIPSLTVASFDVFFEVVLHMAVGAFAVTSHARTSKGPPREGAEKEKNPFHHLHDIAKLISRLLDVYVSQFVLFPRRMVSIVLGSCKHMLSICVFHVIGCVQWRNAQPLISVDEKRAGMHDCGSIRFLELLLQSFATWGAGKVMILCQEISSLSEPSRENDGDSEEEHYVPNDKRFTSLMMSAQKTMETLRSVSSAHNLVPPQLEKISLDTVSKKQPTKRSLHLDDADKGYHELNWKGTVQEDTASDREKVRKKRRRRVTPTLVSAKADRFDGEDDETNNMPQRRRHPVVDDEYECEWDDNGEGSSVSDDDPSHASSDAFGASGHWGGDDHDVEGTSSSESLELEVSDIVQAA